MHELLLVYTKGHLPNLENIHKHLLPDQPDKLHAKKNETEMKFSDICEACAVSDMDPHQSPSGTTAFLC